MDSTKLPNGDADEAERCYCGGIFSRDNPGDPFVCSRCGTRMRLTAAYSKDEDFEAWMDSATPPCELRGGVRWYSEDGLRKAFDAGAMVERENNVKQSGDSAPVSQQIWNAVREYDRLSHEAWSGKYGGKSLNEHDPEAWNRCLSAILNARETLQAFRPTPAKDIEQKLGDTPEWEFAGTVGVDGGHVLIGDANYAKSLSEDWVDRTIRTPGGYDATVKDGVARLHFGFAGGVACVAGRGDGCYRVFVKRGNIPGDEHGPRITHMMIDFTDGEAYND